MEDVLERRSFGTELSEDVTGLPRLHSKQAPARGWEAVQVPQWVQTQLAEAPPLAGHFCLEFRKRSTYRL